jgi:copper chaperone CopZ
MGEEMTTKDLTIQGMNCGHCVMTLKKEFAKLDGVKVESVEIGKSRVQYDEARISLRDIEQAIERSGFHLVSE